MGTSQADGCPECGSQRTYWRIHRTGTRSSRYSPRELRWECRECGHVRIETISDVAETPTDIPPFLGRHPILSNEGKG